MVYKNSARQRAYQKAYLKQHYQDNKAKYKARARAWTKAQIQTNKKRTRDYLLTHPCVDCGEADPVVLEFDHVRGKKTSAVANMSRDAWSWARILEEIAKCEVRCANCHRRVTHKRRLDNAPIAGL